MWILAIIALVAVVGLAFSKQQGAKIDKTDDRIKSRVDAYVDYIKRESPSERFTKMTDNELRDDLASKIRKYPSDVADAKAKSIAIPALLIGAAIIGSLTGIMNEMVVIFVIVVSLFTMTREEKKAAAKIDKEYEENGYSIEKIRLE